MTGFRALLPHSFEGAFELLAPSLCPRSMSPKPMTPVTRLRRQFRERMKDPMAHLLFKRGVYHYHRRVPAVVRAANPGLPETIRRSTGTERLREAQAIVREWATADEAVWLGILEGKAPSEWLQSLRAEPDLTIDRVQELIEQRADRLGVRDELEAASGPAEFPDALLADAKARPAIQAVFAARGEPMTWVEAWEAFEGRSGLSQKTRLAYASSCAQFDKASLPGPSAITRDRAREFLKEAAQRLTRSTINIYTSAATAILTDLYDGDPARAGTFRGHKLRYAKKAATRAELTRDDIKALIATGKVSRQLSVFMQLALGTGGRRQEVHAGTYDLERKLLTVTPEIAKTKSSARQIPLADRLVPLAKEWVELRASGKAHSVRRLQDSFAAAREAAQRPSTKTLHSCRHAFLTELARAGVQVDRRKALAGHSKAQDVHSGYVHLSADDLRQDAAKVDFWTGVEWP